MADEISTTNILSQIDRRCPDCNLNWWLFPPANIHGLPMVRCVECKRVYDEAAGSEINVG